MKGSGVSFPSTRLIAFGDSGSGRASAGSGFFGPGRCEAGCGSRSACSAGLAWLVACMGWLGTGWASGWYSIPSQGCSQRRMQNWRAGHGGPMGIGRISGMCVSKFDRWVKSTWRLALFSASAIASKTTVKSSFFDKQRGRGGSPSGVQGPAGDTQLTLLRSVARAGAAGAEFGTSRCNCVVYLAYRLTAAEGLRGLSGTRMPMQY